MKLITSLKKMVQFHDFTIIKKESSIFYKCPICNKEEIETDIAIEWLEEDAMGVEYTNIVCKQCGFKGARMATMR